MHTNTNTNNTCCKKKITSLQMVLSVLFCSNQNIDMFCVCSTAICLLNLHGHQIGTVRKTLCKLRYSNVHFVSLSFTLWLSNLLVVCIFAHQITKTSGPLKVYSATVCVFIFMHTALSRLTGRKKKYCGMCIHTVYGTPYGMWILHLNLFFENIHACVHIGMCSSEVWIRYSEGWFYFGFFCLLVR